MKTSIQEAIEKLTRYEPGHEPGLMEADQRGDYLRFDDVMEALAKAARQSAAPGERDNCKLCLGAKGGVPGNENVVGGVVVCDYCTSQLLDIKKAGWFAAPAPSEPVQDLAADLALMIEHVETLEQGLRDNGCEIATDEQGNVWVRNVRAEQAEKPAAPSEPVPQGVPDDYHDAYRGARDDLQDWKNRALKAESRLNTLVAEINAESGPTFMGEPAVPAASTATTDKLPTIAGEAGKIRVFNGASAEWQDPPAPKNETDFLLSSPANAAHLGASIGQLGATKSPDANVEKNRELLLQRSIVGLAKYGVTTADNPIPHKEWLQHALEESLDMANYLQAAINRPEPAMGLCREMVKRWDDRDNLSDDDYDAEGLRIESAIRDLINKEGKQ